MDAYKTELNKGCQVGGLFCSCCNDYHGKDKKKLNRIARRRLKRADEKTTKAVDTEQ